MADDDLYEPMFRSLKRSTLYQGYREAFRNATGFVLELHRPGNGKVESEGRIHNDFCTLLRRGDSSCDACLPSLPASAGGGRKLSPNLVCHYGFRNIATPVCVGSTTIGILTSDPVVFEAPSKPRFEALIRRLRGSDLNLDVTRLKEAYFAARVVTPQQYDSIVQLMQIFAQHLSLKANQLMLDISETDPPMVRHAKEFIQQNYQRRLSLEDVAQTVHCSRYHFSKTFSRHVGIPFIDYVARTRIEKAKDLLLNPDLRISEVAFQVGFESLTHFNRLFKRISGYSPTLFRSQRPTA